MTDRGSAAARRAEQVLHLAHGPAVIRAQMYDSHTRPDRGSHDSPCGLR